MSMDAIYFFSFGDVLKALRKKRNINQRELSTKLGVHLNTISKWERGICLPDSKGMVLELAKLLQLSDPEARLLLDASLTALSPHWQVPYQRNPFFTGRTALLQALHTQLNGQQAVALSQSYALSGLGGIGKTQVALEYTYQHALDYRAVFWVAAETPESIDASFTAIAEKLCLPERASTDHQHVIKAVLLWLTTHKEWLLIFDNVEAVSLIKSFLPSARQGAILITTRLHTLEGLAQVLELPPLSPAEGASLLLRRARLFEQIDLPDRLPPDLEGPAYTLVEAMAGLPLALDQAGGYIERTGCSLTDYLRMYQGRQIQLLNERSASADYPHSVVKTILLSFQKLAQVYPAAADLLRLCAFLAPDAIPEEYFTRGATSLGPLLDPVIADVYLFNHLLGEALQYSLLDRQSQFHTLSQHRLVQVVLKDTLDEADARLWATRAAAVVATSVSLEEGQRAEGYDSRHLVHARSVLQHIQQYHGWETQETLVPIWYYIGLVAEQYSQLAEAKSAYLQGLAIAHQRHHPLEAALLAHAGYMTSDLGDDLQALEYLEQAANLARQLHDEGTLCLTLLQQGQIQDNLGNHRLAKTLYQEGVALALRLQNWAAASAFVQDLGVQAVRRGDYQQAELLYREGLGYAQQSKQLARQSALLMNLGMVAIHQQQYPQALAYSLESLDLALQVHHHYRISAVSQNLGIIYRCLNQPEQARHYLNESLRLAQEIQNPWLIAETRGELGWLFLEQERYAEAQEMFASMLAGAQHIQAPQLIGGALFGLAHIAVRRNHWEQARSFARESLECFTQVEDIQRDRVVQWLDTLPSAYSRS